MAKMYCMTCGNIGTPKSSKSIVVLLLLFCLGVIPGLIYLMISGKKLCRACNSNQVVPMNSPNAKRALQQISQEREK